MTRQNQRRDEGDRTARSNQERRHGDRNSQLANRGSNRDERRDRGGKLDSGDRDGQETPRALGAPQGGQDHRTEDERRDDRRGQHDERAAGAGSVSRKANPDQYGAGDRQVGDRPRSSSSRERERAFDEQDQQLHEYAKRRTVSGEGHRDPDQPHVGSGGRPLENRNQERRDRQGGSRKESDRQTASGRRGQQGPQGQQDDQRQQGHQDYQRRQDRQDQSDQRGHVGHRQSHQRPHARQSQQDR